MGGVPGEVHGSGSLYEYSLIPAWFQNERVWHVGKGVELAYHYQTAIILSTVLYLPVLWALNQHMKHRRPKRMALFTFVWNMILSGFSLLGVVLLTLGQWSLLLELTVAEADYYPTTRVVITTFALTKVFEFGDTVLLVLKKKPLSFLHLYHHIFTALFCWHAQVVDASYAHFFAIFNLGIHSAMYFYYAMCTVLSVFPANQESDLTPSNRSLSMKFRYALKGVLQAARPYITISQVIQMFAGLIISTKASLSSSTPEPEKSNAYIATFMYCSFAYLFSQFFVVSYILPKKKVDTPDLTIDAKQTRSVAELQAVERAPLGQGLVQCKKLPERHGGVLSVDTTRMRSAGLAGM
eukprot:GHVS01105399.1.p1 GENE.GHVS01105399.1~~GHVS01105399.1.p1  ORF type:complete len:352 (+),score=17.18 GHVS01105399.1:186-1241(+)